MAPIAQFLVINDEQPLRQAVIEAMEKYEITDSPAWHDVEALSTYAHLDGIEIDPAGIIFEAENRFRGIMNVYVVLEYEATSDGDWFETTDSFVGGFQGHFDKSDKPHIEEVSIDTSSFYEGADETEAR